jgi:undecaprenol kinase
MSKLFDARKFFRSFKYAFRGLYQLVRREQNARIHSVVAVVVLAGIWHFRIGGANAAVLLICIGLVFSLETANTAVEKLLDVVHPESHSQIAFIKDALAGAVLVAAIISLAIGLIVFLPYLH